MTTSSLNFRSNSILKSRMICINEDEPVSQSSLNWESPKVATGNRPETQQATLRSFNWQYTRITQVVLVFARSLNWLSSGVALAIARSLVRQTHGVATVKSVMHQQ